MNPALPGNVHDFFPDVFVQNVLSQLCLGRLLRREHCFGVLDFIGAGRCIFYRFEYLAVHQRPLFFSIFRRHSVHGKVKRANARGWLFGSIFRVSARDDVVCAFFQRAPARCRVVKLVHCLVVRSAICSRTTAFDLKLFEINFSLPLLSVIVRGGQVNGLDPPVLFDALTFDDVKADGVVTLYVVLSMLQPIVFLAQ